jgi:hypothetical protein
MAARRRRLGEAETAQAALAALEGPVVRRLAGGLA